MKVYLPNPTDENGLNSVVIDDYDTWNADISIATVVHPMLVSLRSDALMGYPDELGSIEKWHEIMDAMIYSFDQAMMHYPELGKGETAEDYNKEREKLTAGFVLFGMYYMSLWT